MSVETLIAVLIGIDITAIGGIFLILLRVEGKIAAIEDLQDKYKKLERRTHRHTADLGKIAWKTGVELSDDIT